MATLHWAATFRTDAGLLPLQKEEAGQGATHRWKRLDPWNCRRIQCFLGKIVSGFLNQMVRRFTLLNGFQCVGFYSSLMLFGLFTKPSTFTCIARIFAPPSRRRYALLSGPTPDMRTVANSILIFTKVFRLGLRGVETTFSQLAPQFYHSTPTWDGSDPQVSAPRCAFKTKCPTNSLPTSHKPLPILNHKSQPTSLSFPAPPDLSPSVIMHPNAVPPASHHLPSDSSTSDPPSAVQYRMNEDGGSDSEADPSCGYTESISYTNRFSQDQYPHSSNVLADLGAIDPWAQGVIDLSPQGVPEGRNIFFTTSTTYTPYSVGYKLPPCPPISHATP